MAIKKILPSYADDADFRRMFIDEASIAARLNHANIAQIYEFDVIDDTPYIAMEFVEGKDLRNILGSLAERGQALPYPIASFIALEVAKGLYYVHTRRESSRPLNIVHRDVSPQNIMVSHDGGVKLVDFGIARASKRSANTQVGTVKGKFGYMSPEQALGRPIDHRSDIFSLGVVLWEMLTGQRLFRGENDAETVTKLLKTRVPPPHTVNAEVPQKLSPIVLRALQREREDRYPTMLAFYEDLTEFLVKTGSYPDIDKVSRLLYDLFPEDMEKLWQGEHLDLSEEEMALAPPQGNADLDSVLGDELPDPLRPPQRREPPVTKGGGSPQAVSDMDATRAKPVEDTVPEFVLTTPMTQAPSGPIATFDPKEKVARTRKIASIALGVLLIVIAVAFGVTLTSRLLQDKNPSKSPTLTADAKHESGPSEQTEKDNDGNGERPLYAPKKPENHDVEAVATSPDNPDASSQPQRVEGLLVDDDEEMEEDDEPVAVTPDAAVEDLDFVAQVGDDDTIEFLPVAEPTPPTKTEEHHPPEIVTIPPTPTDSTAEEEEPAILSQHERLLEKKDPKEEATADGISMFFEISPKDAVLRVAGKKRKPGKVLLPGAKPGDLVSVQGRRAEYMALDQNIEVQEGATVKLQLRRRAEVELRVSPQKARVEINGRTLRRSGPKQRLFAFVATAGDVVDIRVSKGGYETETRKVTLHEGLNKLLVDLQPDRTRHSKNGNKKQNEEAAMEGYGFIFAQKKPYGDVYIDGEHKGDTPVTLRVKAGKHLLEFRQMGKVEAVDVEVEPGKTTRVVR